MGSPSLRLIQRFIVPEMADDLLKTGAGSRLIFQGMMLL